MEHTGCRVISLRITTFSRELARKRIGNVEYDVSFDDPVLRVSEVRFSGLLIEFVRIPVMFLGKRAAFLKMFDVIRFESSS